MFALLLAIPAAHAGLAINGVGRFTPANMPEGLSGITAVGSTQFIAVNDSGGQMTALTIHLHPISGAITSTVVGVTHTLDGADLEGIAYDAARHAVLVSDETGATLSQYAISNGQFLAALDVPSIYTRYRANYSLEALTESPDGLTLWTANEEALFGAGVNDGPLSTAATGSVVRLQKWSRAATNTAWTVAGQWAYHTERWVGGDSPFINLERSGISDLCVLPSGKLLVLERDFSGSFIPVFRNRIYGVDFSAATMVSNMAALAGAAYTKATKLLLWSDAFGVTDNFEGLCLGPRLSATNHSLLLISDGDQGINRSLYALALTTTGTDAWQTFEIRSEHAAATPPVGFYTHIAGSIMTNATTEQITFGTTQFVSAGWAMTGCEPSAGTTNRVLVTLTNDAVLTWLWSTNYWVATTVAGLGTVQPDSGWAPAGTNLTLRAVPALHSAFTRWQGDVPEALATNHVLSITVTNPLHVTAVFVFAPLPGPLLLVR